MTSRSTAASRTRSSTPPSDGAGPPACGAPAGAVLALIGVGGASATLYAANFRLAPLAEWLGLAAPGAPAVAVYPALFGALFALYALAVLLVLGPARRVSPAVVVGFGLAFRVGLVPSPLVLSTDLYRYVWDGRVQAAGVNPYRYPPSDPALAPLRDSAIFPFVNRPDAPTIYPPGAQAAFALIHRLTGDSVVGMKAVMVVADLGTMLLIRVLLRRAGRPPAWLVVYAWSPLAVFELAGSGHVEALMLPLVLLALLARMDGRPIASGVALGGAALIKLYPVILLAALTGPRGRRVVLASGATIALGYVPYVYRVGLDVLGFLPAYFSTPWEDFNVGLRDWISAGVGLVSPAPRTVAMALVGVALVAFTAAVSLRPEPPLARAQALATAYLLLLPTSLHPWYVVWLVPFLCVRPSWAGLYLSGAVSLSYLKYASVPGALPRWVPAVEFLPVYALLALATWQRRDRRSVRSILGTRRPGVGPRALLHPSRRPGGPDAASP